MTAPTIVRSFWGQGELTFFKAARDIREALNQQRLVGRVYAFGNYAAYFLRLVGVEFTALPSTMPRAYAEDFSKPAASMWWHKLVAIRQAILDTSGPVVHLDWDTECLCEMPDLSQGPAFQGRLRSYNRPQHTERDGSRRQVYHGGCMYFRDTATVERAMHLHATFSRNLADEAAATALADELCQSTDAEAHRAKGCDNPALYTTGRDVVPSNIMAAFKESERIKKEEIIPFVSELIARARRETLGFQ